VFILFSVHDIRHCYQSSFLFSVHDTLHCYQSSFLFSLHDTLHCYQCLFLFSVYDTLPSFSVNRHSEFNNAISIEISHLSQEFVMPCISVIVCFESFEAFRLGF
jgi:hypothetical protein